MRSLALVTLVAITAATSPGWHTFSGDGVSVHFPPGWHATAVPLTAVTSPTQILAVAPFPPPKTDVGADGCEPKEALERMPSGGAFIYGWEYGQLSNRLGIRPRDFPPRPAHFTLSNLANYECMGRSYMLRFSDRDWAFQIHVYLGSHANAATRLTVLRILDSFRKT